MDRPKVARFVPALSPTSLRRTPFRKRFWSASTSSSDRSVKGLPGTEVRLATGAIRHTEVKALRSELGRQAAIARHSVERLASVSILWHLEHSTSGMRHHRPSSETEISTTRAVMQRGESQGIVVQDVHNRNLSRAITRVDPLSGELRLNKIAGLARIGGGTALLTPNARGAAVGLGGTTVGCGWR